MDILFRHNTKYFDLSYIRTNNDLIDTILSVSKYLISLNNIIFKLYGCIINNDRYNIIPYYAINTYLYQIIFTQYITKIDIHFFSNVINAIIYINQIYDNNGNIIYGVQHNMFGDIIDYYNSIKINTFDDIYNIIKYNTYELTHNENIEYNDVCIKDYYDKGIALLNELNTIGLTKYINNKNELYNINYHALQKKFKNELNTKNVKMNVVKMRIKRQLYQLKNVPNAISRNKIQYYSTILHSIYVKYNNLLKRNKQSINKAYKNYIQPIHLIKSVQPIKSFFVPIKIQLLKPIREHPFLINSKDKVIKFIIYLLYTILYNNTTLIDVTINMQMVEIDIFNLYNNVVHKKQYFYTNKQIINGSNTYEKIYKEIYKNIKTEKGINIKSFYKENEENYTIKHIFNIMESILQLCNLNIILARNIVESQNQDIIMCIFNNNSKIEYSINAYILLSGIIQYKINRSIINYIVRINDITYIIYTLTGKNEVTIDKLTDYYICIGIYKNNTLKSSTIRKPEKTLFRSPSSYSSSDTLEGNNNDLLEEKKEDNNDLLAASVKRRIQQPPFMPLI